MATPNIVPKADQEGGLGTAAKAWGNLFIEHPATGADNSAATISNKDIDQKALHIEASNTTANVLDVNASALTTANALLIDCNALTTGSAIKLDIDDALTTSATKSLLLIDYDKSGATGAGETSITTGLDISMVDATGAAHGSAAVTSTGVDVRIDAPNTTGTISQTGFSATLTDGDTATTIGYLSNTEDGSTDFKAVSSADTADFFSIATTASGATTLATVDGGAAAAHLTVAPDGDLLLTPGSGAVKIYDSDNAADNLSIGIGTNGDTTLTTTDAAGFAAHFEIAADGNITLDAAANISLESGSSSASHVTIDHRKFTKTSTTDGDAVGDIVYFGGTTSMTIGAIYHYKSDGTWELADADAAATSDGLLAVALGEESDGTGMLLRGTVTLDHDPGAVGDVLYLSTTAGDSSATAPSGTGDIVRIIGYCLDASNGQIWFNPDNTFVEIS
jgi:hypothetical protein